MWSFNYQWKKFDVQKRLYGRTIQEELDLFMNNLEITPSNLTKESILDAGCGSGRLDIALSKKGPKIIGTDISDLPKEQLSIFIKSDILHLPFADKAFDHVYCKGVIHHTPDPKKAFDELARVCKKRLHVMVYSNRNIPMLIRKYFVTYKYPLVVIRVVSYILAVAFYIPLNVRKIVLIPKSSKKFDIQSIALLNFDYLSPKYQSVHSAEELSDWFTAHGFKVKFKSRDKFHCGILGIRK